VTGSCVVLALAGCESSQHKSARLEKSAKHSIAEQAHIVKRPSTLVSIQADTVLRTKDRAAAIITVRNKADRPIARVPIEIHVLGAGGEKLFGNDVPGLQTSLIEVPLIRARGSFTWVNDQLSLSSAPKKLEAMVGDPKQRVGGIPELRISKVQLHADPVSGIEAEGKVENRSKVKQVNLVVFGVARRGGKVVAAGRALVPKLKPGRKANFSIFWVGNPRGAKLEISAPPTVLG
jgi:hypothetical protein